MTDFYSENRNRDYPFRQRLSGGTPQASIELPQSAIVEASVIVGPAVVYDPIADAAYLFQVTRQDPLVWFDFRVTSLSDRRLVFVVDQTTHRENDVHVGHDIGVTDALPTTETWPQLDQPEFPYCPDSPSCDFPDLSGQLVVGKLDDILAQLANNASWTFAQDDWVLEPSRVMSLYMSLVTGITTVNGPRQVYIPPAGCTSNATSPGYQESVSCVSGDVTFEEGYNVQISHSKSRNEIVFRAAVGAGAGEPCQEIAYFPGDAIPTGSRYYSGGPACDELIHAVNGVVAPNLNIIPGTGIRVYADPNQANMLVIEAKPDDLASCP